MAYRDITRTLVVTSILPVGGERVHTVYAYDTQGRCYAYQAVLGSSIAAAKVADATLGRHVDDLPWAAWHTYIGDPLTA